MDSKNDSVLAIHMGEAFNKLSPLLQKTHIGNNQLKGTVNVCRGNWIAHIVCNAFHFPKEGENVPLQVDCSHTPDSMIWVRDFNGLKMKSHFQRKGEYLIEHLGPLAMSFKAVEEHAQLHYAFIHTRCFGIPVPKFLSPQVVAFETENNGQYEFNVEVRLFLIGKVLSYGGRLAVTEVE